eukprot:jgi/Botrbrau1/4977/Bobra.0396s0006.1
MNCISNKARHLCGLTLVDSLELTTGSQAKFGSATSQSTLRDRHHVVELSRMKVLV